MKIRKSLSALMLLTLLLANAPSAAKAVSSKPIVNRYDSFRKMAVTAKGKKFNIERVTINLANPKLRILTLTGTNSDNCHEKKCLTRSLASYVKEARAFTAINGTYFCPKDYASCAGQEGAYFWMVFNTRKNVFVNRKQNKFNHGPLITFDVNKNWQIYPDTSLFSDFNDIPGQAADPITAAISNGPLLINRGLNVVDPSDLDLKQRTVKSARSGLGILGTKLYLVVAHQATVPDLGDIMKAMGMEYAINLDGGGSSALWYRGAYQSGPGRNIPNALLFAE